MILIELDIAAISAQSLDTMSQETMAVEMASDWLVIANLGTINESIVRDLYPKSMLNTDKVCIRA